MKAIDILKQELQKLEDLETEYTSKTDIAEIRHAIKILETYKEESEGKSCPHCGSKRVIFSYTGDQYICLECGKTFRIPKKKEE